MSENDALMTIGQVAVLLGIPRSRLAYLVERGDVVGPTAEVPGRRLFAAEQVDAIRKQLAARERRSTATSAGISATR